MSPEVEHLYLRWTDARDSFREGVRQGRLQLDEEQKRKLLAGVARLSMQVEEVLHQYKRNKITEALVLETLARCLGAIAV